MFSRSEMAKTCGRLDVFTRLMGGLVVLFIFYVLSVGPIDRLADANYLPLSVLGYQSPLYQMASHLRLLDRFLHWYVGDVWGVFEPNLRDAPLH